MNFSKNTKASAPLRQVFYNAVFLSRDLCPGMIFCVLHVISHVISKRYHSIINSNKKTTKLP